MKNDVLFYLYSETLINWSALHLFWLRDTNNLVFPDIDYDAIEIHGKAMAPVNFEWVERLCEVDIDRKAALCALTRKRVKNYRLLFSVGSRSGMYNDTKAII